MGGGGEVGLLLSGRQSGTSIPPISGMVLTADRARVKGHSVYYVPQGLRHHWA